MIMQSSLRSRAAALFACALAQACSATHEIEKADTATSWLRACVQDDECGGVGRCLNHVCTLSCGDDRSCGAMAPGARCESVGGESERTCTLGCARATDCAALGAEFECQERSCRPRSMLDMSTQALVLESPVATRAPGAVVNLDLGAVGWVGDRWRLLLVAPNDMNFNVKELLALAEIDGAGARILPSPYVEPRFPAGWVGPFGAIPVAMAPDGTVATVLSSGSNPLFPESKESLQVLLPDGSGRPALECSGRMSVLPISRTSEWVVLCDSNDATVSVGRYDPRSDQWSIPATVVVRERGPEEAATMELRGDDLLLFLEDSAGIGRVGRLLGATREATRELSEVPVWHKVDSTFLRVNEGDGLFAGGLSGDWLLPAWYGNTFRSEFGATSWGEPLEQQQQPTGFRVLEDGDLTAPVRFRLSVSESMSLLGVQGLPGTGRIAFCYEERHRSEGVDRTDLLLSVFESDGTPIAGPTRIASSPRAVTWCELSWSERALLATWRVDPANSDVASTLHARVIPLR